MDGRTLVPLLEGKSLPARPVFAETGIWFTRQIPDVPPSLRLPYPDITEVLEVDLDHDGELVARNSFEPWLVAAKHRMVRDERYKLVYAPTREGTKWMLFDTRQDPLEVSNVAGLHPEIAARLQGLLWSWMLEDQLSARRGEAVEPQPAPAPTSTATALASTRFAGVAIRLSELLATASVDTPNLASVDASLDHWRRMPSPWIRKAARSDRAVQQIALVRGDGTQKLAPISADRTWAPDPHLWNMNVGSFDQRESILAPPPSTLRFTGLTLPRGATLQTAPAVVGANPTGVEFEVAVKSGNGPRSIVALRRIEAGIPEAFQDWRVDLSPWNGKVIDLELVTRSAPAPTVPAAIWGSPVIVAADSSDVPFNVLYIVVDALRGDAIASTHDDATDARMQSAKFGPLDAWLPRLAEVAPNLDALARRGVIFSQAYSSATWTRPSTVAMMAGIPSRALGMSATPLVPQAAELQNLYAQRPPFLPLLLRPHGVWTRAIVNNYYMVGYAGVGVDMGFDALIDHRHNTRDTAEIVNDAKLELDRSKDHRYFLFVNFVSPHSPYEPPASAIEAIPKPPRGPQHEIIRMYLAEVHKDDAAIGELIERLGQLGLSDNTLIVVTADHGETLSRAHTAIPFGLAGEPDTSGRFQHLLTLYDETARVPLLLVLPGKLPAGTRVQDPVSNTDVVATLLALAGIAPPANVRGESLLPLVHGQRLPERPILVEGRGAHAIRVGRWRLIVREPGHTRVRIKGAFVEQPLELYDLETDPGERVEVSQLHPDVVERLLAVDKAQQSTTPLLRTPAATAGPSLRLRFAGAGARHKVRGRISTSNQQGASITSASEVSIGPNALRRMRDAVELDFETVPDRVVGVDLIVEPPNANITWHFALDDKPWPEERVYAGSLGMVARELATGLLDDNSRGTARASTLPWIDPEYDLGMFVIGNASEEVLELGSSDAAKQEAMGLMRSWGYVR
jgi:arylsulfatase A-like enzyme